MNQKNKNIYSLIEKHIKLAPLYTLSGLIVILLSSFLYNAGYFCLLDIRLMSFLTLSDYYEGTLPFVFMGFLFLIFLFSMLIYILNIGAANLVVQFWKQLFFTLYRIIKAYVKTIYLQIRILENKYKLKLLFPPETKKYSKLLKKNNTLLQDLSKIKKEMKTILKLLLKNFLRTSLMSFVLFILPLFELKTKIVNVNLYIFVTIVYVAIIGLYIMIIKSTKAKIVFYCIVSCIVFFLLGLISFSNSHNKETLFLFTKNNAEPFIMMRAINKGFIVKQNRKKYFIPNDYLKHIYINNNSSKEDIAK